MRHFAFSLILVSVFLLYNGATSDDTVELPRKAVTTTPHKIEEINENGQKRYRIQTENYDIIAPRIEDGKLIGERLENLFDVWTLLAAEFGKESKKEPVQQRLRVILYRNQQEYRLNLYRLEPLIAETNGLYFEPRKTVYFFSADEPVLLHEGTHQILAEHFFPEKTHVFRSNFWIVEGIALFMQTLKVEEKRYTVGDILANRLYSAKVYRFEWNHNLPIQKLTAMSKEYIQNSRDLQKIYSQSATLTHWLMFAEEGRYRAVLFELLRRTYLGTAKPETLSELTGLSYEELDKKYTEFLKTIPDDEKQSDSKVNF